MRIKRAVDGGIAHGAERCASARSEKNGTFSQICVTYVCRSSCRIAILDTYTIHIEWLSLAMTHERWKNMHCALFW